MLLEFRRGGFHITPCRLRSSDFVGCDNTIVNDVIEVRDRIWNLNVAEPFQIQGYTFIIQSKARAGNVLMNGK